MYAEVLGTTTYGLNGHVIGVEVDIRRAAEALEIVGLPAASVKESKAHLSKNLRKGSIRQSEIPGTASLEIKSSSIWRRQT